MSDDATVLETPDLGQQVDIELPDGVVVTGAGEGADSESLIDSLEERHDELNPPAPEAPKRVPRGQKRIDQLTGEREAAVRRAEAAEQRAKDLEAQLAKPATAAVPVGAPQSPQAPVAAAPVPSRPKPQEAEIGTKYKTLSDYFEDLSDWKAEQREAALLTTFDARLQAGIEADRASRTRTEHWSRVFDSGRAAFTDFDATLHAVDDVILPPSVQDVIGKMPQPERIMYALAKNRPVLEGLGSLKDDPVRLTLTLASLNGVTGSEAVAPAPASTPAPVRTSQAPAPPQPVSGGTRTARTSSADIANTGGSFEAYKATRTSERGVH